MNEVKWIKLFVDIWDNRKIKQIETLPDGDAVLIIWLKLLTLAGNVNDGGLVYFTPEIPYTDEMLSAQFNKPLQTVKMALEVFQRFGMIEIINDILCVSNWEKYQNIESMEKVREQTRKRVSDYRERQKLLCNVTSNVTVTECNAIEERKKKEDRRKKNNKHIYGEYKHVLLSDEEFEKLKDRFPDSYERKIKALDEGIELKGYKYKSHYLAILKWAEKDDKMSADYMGGGGKVAETLEEAREQLFDFSSVEY